MAPKSHVLVLLLLGVLLLLPSVSALSVTKLGDPSTLPTGLVINGAEWSPDGRFLAVAHQTTPFVSIYERTGTTFVKVPDPSTLPTGQGRDVAWSPDGNYLAVGHAVSPFLTIYERSGLTFTKLANPASLPISIGASVTWNSAGNLLAVGVSHASEALVVYEQSGTTFTKVSVASLPPGAGNDVSFSADGVVLTVPHTLSPFVTQYSVAGTTLTKLADPATLPTGAGVSAAWHPCDCLLVIGSVSYPFMTIYERSGTTFTATALPETLPTSESRFDWHPDGTKLANSIAAAPYMQIYSYGGGELTNPEVDGDITESIGTAIAWSPPSVSGGMLLAQGHFTSPFLSIYQVSGSTGIDAVSPVGIIMDSAKEGFGLTDEVANWIFGILTVTLVSFAFFKVSGASAVATSIGGLLGVGLGVAFGFLPVWFLLLVIFAIVAVAGKNLFGGTAAGEM